MHFSTLISTLAFFAATGLAAYTLEDDYFAQGFLDQFTLTNATDTNSGFVQYQSLDQANALQLIEQGNNSITLKVDSKNSTPNGRPSLHLTSKKSYQNGLIVADIGHMPGGICGTWPAFWTVGPNWPNGGEIDILEGVNDQTSNNITLHTGSSAVIANNGLFTGAMTHNDCGPNGENTGCQITADDDQSYGSGFNAAGGGIYAMEWTDSVINIFFFSNANKTSIHDNAVSSSPDPSTWGKPLASFSGAFDLATAFVNQQIIINTDFCGTWAGSVWNDTSCHSEQWPTCEKFVEANPAAFAEAYWQFSALKVYRDDGNQLAATSSSASASTSSSTSIPAPSSSAPVDSSTPDVAPSSSAPIASSTPDVASSTSTPAPVSSSTPATAPSPSSIPSSSSSASASTPSSSSTPTETPPAYTPRPTRFTTMSTIVATETTTVYVTVHTSSEAAQPSGYSPTVGGDGGVDTASEEGNFETGPDGEVEYEGRKRHARHLGVHRRREGRVRA